MKKIFISYQHDKLEEANDLQNFLTQFDVEIVRDVEHLKALDSIPEFMQRIQDADFAILLISDAYLKSKNCLQEILNLLQSKRFEESVVPLLLPCASITTASGRITYLDYWDKEIKNLEQKYKKIAAAFTENIRKEIDQLNNIRRELDKFLAFVSEHLFFRFDSEREKNFEDLDKYLSLERIVDSKYETPKNESNINNTLHIIDQMYDSLQGFHGFNTIFPRTIARMQPFYTQGFDYDNYSLFCLKTNNSQIEDVLEKVKVENYELIIEDETFRPFEEKLRFIFKTLNFALINCICIREKHEEKKHFPIQLHNPNILCDCVECRFSRLDLKSILNESELKSLKPAEDTLDDLRSAYFLCLVGEFSNGWKIFNRIAASQENRQSVSSFFALLNIKKLRPFVNVPWIGEEKEVILEDIAKIRIEDTLCLIDLPEIVKSELTRVKEEYHLNYCREKIEEYCKSIQNTYELYLRNGYSYGSRTVSLLLNEVYLLFIFYHRNNLLETEYFTFKETVSKGIVGLFTSYATDDSHKGKLVHFDLFTIRIIMMYFDDEELFSIIHKYKLEDIKIAEKDRVELLELFANYFQFQYTKTWGHIEPGPIILARDYFSELRQKLRQYFERIIQILTYFDFRSDELKGISQNLIEFLSIADLQISAWKYFNHFIEKKIEIFDETQLKFILYTIVERMRHKNVTSVIDVFCISARNFTNLRITDRTYLERILSEIKQPCIECGHKHEFLQFIKYWPLITVNLRAYFRKECISHLSLRFNPGDFERMVHDDILTLTATKRFLGQYLEYFDRHTHANDLQSQGKNDRVTSYIGHNCISLLAKLDVDFNHPLIQKVAQKAEYYNWLINPQDFNYSVFQLSWLKNFCPYYIKIKLKGIKELKEIIRKSLTEEYDSELAEIYVKYFQG